MLMLLLACPPAPDSSTDSGNEPACTASFNQVFPADGSTNVYIRSPLQFYLTQPDPSAQIVTDIPGHMSVSEDGRILSWIADGPMAPQSSNSLTLQGCFGTATTHFQTSWAGQPLEAGVAGRSYLLNLKGGRADTQVAELMTPYLVGFVRLEVLTQTQTALSLRAAYSRTNDFSEECTVTQQYAVFQDQPYFVTIPSDLAFPHLYHAQLSGTFTPDGSRVEGLHLTGQWDVRDLEADGLNPDGETPEQLCGILAAVKLPCTRCDDGELRCVDLSASLIPGEELRVSPATAETCSACSHTPLTGPWLIGGLLAGLFRRRPQSSCS